MRYAELAACTLVAAACMPPSYGVILEAGADDTTDTDTDTDTGEPPIEWHGEPLPPR
jgi:hypothetical protein